MPNESVRPVRIAFDCTKCFKSLQLEERIYKKAYEGHTLCMSCRPAENPAQILTEEELKEIEKKLEITPIVTSFINMDKILASHRSLLSANENLNGHIEGLMQSLEDREPYYAQEYQKMLAINAELSFKNPIAKAKVKEYYLGLKGNVGKSGLTEMDVYHATQAIENVLHAFNIKIEGVNA